LLGLIEDWIGETVACGAAAVGDPGRHINATAKTKATSPQLAIFRLRVIPFNSQTFKQLEFSKGSDLS
jgi:hypothetical protein